MHNKKSGKSRFYCTFSANIDVISASSFFSPSPAALSRWHSSATAPAQSPEFIIGITASTGMLLSAQAYIFLSLENRLKYA